MRGKFIDSRRFDRQHNVAFSKGGRTKMFSEQSASPARGGRAGKGDDRGLGARAARGGQVESAPRSAKPAAAGRTSPR